MSKGVFSFLFPSHHLHYHHLHQHYLRQHYLLYRLHHLHHQHYLHHLHGLYHLHYHCLNHHLRGIFQWHFLFGGMFGHPCVKDAWQSCGRQRFPRHSAIRTTWTGVLLKQMRCSTAGDADGFVVNMFKYGTVDLHIGLVSIFNDMSRVGISEPKWQTTLFTLLPKTGDTSKPNSWKPIAALKATYIFFRKWYMSDYMIAWIHRALTKQGSGALMMRS